MKSFFVIVSALVFLAVAVLQALRAYYALPVVIDGHAVPILCSWAAAGVTLVLALGLIIFGRK
jgi:hypothetical protein